MTRQMSTRIVVVRLDDLGADTQPLAQATDKKGNCAQLTSCALDGVTTGPFSPRPSPALRNCPSAPFFIDVVVLLSRFF